MRGQARESCNHHGLDVVIGRRLAPRRGRTRGRVATLALVWTTPSRPARLAAPLPTILPSYNQIGFDSIHYVLGAATGVVPLPWLPNVMVKRVRGALVHDRNALRRIEFAVDAKQAVAADVHYLTHGICGGGMRQAQRVPHLVQQKAFEIVGCG